MAVKTSKKSAKVAKSSVRKRTKGTTMARKATPNSASQMIDERTRELGDWRGLVLKRLRELIHEADPEVVEEWKWQKPSSPGTPI